MEEIKHVMGAYTKLAPSSIDTLDVELNQFWGISYPKFIDRLVETANVKVGERLLAIATGTAVLPLKLISGDRNQQQVVGLDVTEAMLAQGRKAISNDGGKQTIDLAYLKTPPVNPKAEEIRLLFHQ